MISFAFGIGRAPLAALCLISLVISSPAFADSACEAGLEEQFGKVVEVHDKEFKGPDALTKEYVLENCEHSSKSEANMRAGHIDRGVKWGACELSNLAIHGHYQELKVRYAAYCKTVEALNSEKEGCGSKSDKDDIKSCITKLNKGLEAAQSKFAEAKKAIAETHLKKLRDWKEKNKKLLASYKRDQKRIAEIAAGMPVHFEANQGFKNDEEYKALIQPPLPGAVTAQTVGKNRIILEPEDGELLEEQKLAEENVDRYLKAVDSFKKESGTVIDNMKTHVRELNERLTGMKSDDGMGKYVAPAAAAAPAAAGLLGGGAKTASSSSGISGVAAAAVPLAGVALAASNSGGGGASGASSIPMPGATPAAPATVAPTSFGGPVAAAEPDKDTSNKLSDSAKDEKKSEPVAAVLASSFGADGSSRAGSFKKGAKGGTAESGTAVAQANFANTGEELAPISFGGGKSRAPSSSPAGDVTNLLGQMKSLFNFDEGGAAPGAPGSEGTFAGGAPLAGAVPGQPGEPSAVDLTSGETAGEEAPALAEGAHEDTGVQGATLATQNDSLFSRVHKRHRRCQERGLLVMNHGGIRQ